MGANKKILRGLQDICTLSGNVDRATISYKEYMKISCLEMEKFRRNKERESAMQRVSNIDIRLQEIEAEKASLLQNLNKQDSRGNPLNAPSIAPNPKTFNNRGMLKLKY